jgi:succinate dehydrogenase / fumarate reductase, membrane anchor subunit
VVRVRFTGLKAWWVQRVSALYMLLFVVFLLCSFALQPLRTFSQWHAWLARSSTSVAFLVFFTALLGHMWVGLRDVLLDYAKPANLRRSLLAAVALGLLGMGAWVLSILLRLQG